MLNLGCEWSIFTDGIVPGPDHAARAATLANPLSWPAMPFFNRRLAGLLERARKAARDAFSGPITYAAALWERVDWSGFDIAGMNYYRIRWNRIGFERRLRRQHRHRKPVVITEFGCGSFRGAADLGPQSHTIVEATPTGPQVPAAYTRDEQVQATYLADPLRCYARAGVHGAFVFEFIEPNQPHSPNPADDLDMTGYALVASQPEPTATSRWRPKAAFHEVARIYEDWARHQPVEPDRT